jgi:two-component system chemotaxis response regulator CheY
VQLTEYAATLDTENEEMMKALVVEKSSTMRSVLRRILSMRGFEVTEAGDVKGALDALNSMGSSDVAMVQWNAHDFGTLELVAGLRNKPPHKTTIIMMAEAEPGIRELQQTLMVGADDYLVKPFTSLQIDEKLEQAGLTQQMGGLADRQGLSCR